MIPPADHLWERCRAAGLLWSQALWLADLPPDRTPHDLTGDERQRVAECVGQACPPLGLSPLDDPRHHGGCLPVEVTADEGAIARREVRHLALWNVAARLRTATASGPSLFDLEAEAVDPVAEMRARWAEWQSLAGDAPDYQLAWCVGAFRLLGVGVEWAGGKPAVRLNGRPADDIAPLLDLLRAHRPAVVEHLAVGRPFDSLAWQVDLLKKAAGDWSVWGVRAGGVSADGRRLSILPVLLPDIPPFYDAVWVYRPDCFRAVPAEAMSAVKSDSVGRCLSVGMVWVGPATADYPEGRGKVLYEERKIRQAHGQKVNHVRP